MAEILEKLLDDIHGGNVQCATEGGKEEGMEYGQGLPYLKNMTIY